MHHLDCIVNNVCCILRLAPFDAGISWRDHSEFLQYLDELMLSKTAYILKYRNHILLNLDG